MAREISWVRIVAALLAVAGGGYAQWVIRQDNSRLDAGVWLLGAALLAAVFLGRPRGASLERIPQPAKSGSALWLAVAAVGAAAYVYAIHLLTVRWHINFSFAAPLAIVAVGICSIGLGRRFRPAAAPPWPRWETVAFIIILAIGLFARFYRYDYYPPEGVCAVEEPQSGQWTHTILANGARPWEFVGDRWLAVPFFHFFGESMLTLRLPYTIVSWLTLIPFYLLVRLLVGRGAALFATALFAMSSWHLFYARLAHAVFPTTLIEVMVLHLTVRAHRRQGLGVYPWIGFLCGYTLYTYAGYRGIPGFAVIFLGLSFCINLLAWRRAQPDEVVAARRNVGIQFIGLLIALAFFIGPILPLQARLAGENQGHFFEAIKRSMIDNQQIARDPNLSLSDKIYGSMPLLWGRAIMTARLFNHLGDGSETFNLPGEPMLDPMTGTMFALGLIYCVLWWRHRWQGYFSFVFLTLLIGGAVLVGNFDPRRLQGIIPLIYVLIAFAADRFVQVGWARLGRAAAVVLVTIGGVLIGVTYYFNWDVFFVQAINNPRVREAFQNRYTVAVRYLKTLPDGAYMIFVSDVPYFFGTSDLEFMRGNRIPGVVSGDLLGLFRGERSPWTGHDLRVLMQEPYEHEALANLIKATFPGAECEDATHPDRKAQSMTACRIPDPEQTRFSGGIRARYYRGAGEQAFLERSEPSISYAFLPMPCQFPYIANKVPCRAEWEGELQIKEGGTYRFETKGRRGTLRVLIDDQPLQPAMELTAGTHRVRAEARWGAVTDESQQPGARLLWRRGPDAPWDLVPFGVGEPSE